ncbi:MAG: redoxin family protein [Pseudomonadota bacterium]
METKLNTRNVFLACGMAAAVALTVGALIASTADAETDIVRAGTLAPSFTGTTSTGDIVSLSDFAGQTVVLEWSNHDCPFVVKHYDAEFTNMQSQQAGATGDEVVWLTVISSAPGLQGHVSPDQANELTTSRGAAPSHVIIDEDGTIGGLYQAITTPHMFVIDGDGMIQYDGAIDSIKSTRTSDIPKADQYVVAALDAMATGGNIDVTSSAPYGCSVKY